MYVARDMDGTLWCGWDKPAFIEADSEFCYEEDVLELPTQLFWTEVQPGDCRWFGPSDFIYRKGVEVQHAQ